MTLILPDLARFVQMTVILQDARSGRLSFCGPLHFELLLGRFLLEFSLLGIFIVSQPSQRSFCHSSCACFLLLSVSIQFVCVCLPINFVLFFFFSGLNNVPMLELARFFSCARSFLRALLFSFFAWSPLPLCLYFCLRFFFSSSFSYGILFFAYIPGRYNPTLLSPAPFPSRFNPIPFLCHHSYAFDCVLLTFFFLYVLALAVSCSPKPPTHLCSCFCAFWWCIHITWK